MTAGDWALLALAAFAVFAVTVNLYLDFLGHLTDVRRAYRNPGSHTGPAPNVAEQIRAQETARLRLNQLTQEMPPLVPTGPVQIWRDNTNEPLIAVEGVAWKDFDILIVCCDPDHPDVWCIIHRPTGETLWTGYPGPEEALEGVGRLSHVCDWASPAAVEQWKQLMREGVS